MYIHTPPKRDELQLSVSNSWIYINGSLDLLPVLPPWPFPAPGLAYDSDTARPEILC